MRSQPILHTQRRISGHKTDKYRILVNLIWILGICYSFILMFGISDNLAVYLPERFRCGPSNFSNPQYRVVNTVLVFCVILLPMVVIVTLTFTFSEN
eukprot:sb/3479109/